MQCEAKSKQSGQRCKRHAVPGKRVCVIHGGKSASGAASATFKHGRYSKDLPTRLAQRYHEAQADSELLELREEIALVDSRLADLLLRVDSGEAGHWWKELKRIYGEYQEAVGKSDVATMSKRLAELGGSIQSGTSDYHAWGEVYNVIEQRRKLVESERKRMVELGQMISAAAAMVLIARLTEVIQTHVTDKRALAAIAADVGKLIAQDPANGPAG